MRELSGKFLDNFKNTNGLLYPIYKRLKQDDTLMLAIRDRYINIYYRGGSLLKIKEQGQNSYLSTFDEQYNKTGKIIPKLPTVINHQDKAREWVDHFSLLKEIMDFYFSKQSKPEREFQQLIARENNISNISNDSEYFISDIEFADSGLNARFDMLAVRWLDHNAEVVLVAKLL